MTFVDLLIWVRKKEEKFYKRPEFYTKKIKKIAQEFLPDPKVYLFGSYVKGKMRPDSDIDVLVIDKKANFDKGIRVKVEVSKRFNRIHPFELHVITPQEYDGWYKNFIKDQMIEIK